MSTMFSSLLSWLVSFALFVPFQILKLVGLLFPSCSDIGIVGFTQQVTAAAVGWMLFLYPILQYVPWTFVWNFLSAVFLYIFVTFLVKNLTRVMGFVVSFWWIIAIFYVLGGLISIFTSNAWMDSDVFGAVFGTSPTSTGAVGGGFGGGGGGGW